MPSLFWNPLTVNFLIESILASLIALYFAWELVTAFKIRQKRFLTALLSVMMTAAAFGVITQLFAHSVHPDFRNYLHPWVSPAGAIGMSGFVLFAFYFQRKDTRPKWPGVVIGVMLVCVVLLEILIANLRISVLQDGYVEFRQAWVDVPFTIGFLAAHFFFAKSLAEALALEMGSSVWRAVIPTLKSIFWPFKELKNEAKIARAFFYAAIIPSIFALNLLAQSYGLIGWQMAELLNTWTFLGTLAGFTIVYLNYIAISVTMRIKLLGITLTVVLSICSGFSWLIGGQYVEVYRNEHQLAAKTAIRFEPQADGGFIVARTRYHFDRDFGDEIQNSEPPIPLPFLFPFYGETYAQIFAREAGIVGFKFRPLWRDVQHQFGPQPALYLLAADLVKHDQAPNSGLFAKIDKDRVTLTWNRLVAKYGEPVDYTFQLRLYATGVIEMIYDDLPTDVLHEVFVPHAVPSMMGIVPDRKDREVIALHYATDLPFQMHSNAGMMDYFRIDFLQYLNRIYFPTAVFILVISLLILLIFPRFFQTSFSAPLQNLINGVREILDGKLSTKIDESSRDELGFLASSFNEMAQAQHELVNTLEDRVAERTEEVKQLVAKTARLEERSHWTRELHDAVSQTLFSANLIADSLPKIWQKNPELGQKALDSIRQLNKDALGELRHLLLEAQPDKLASQTFGQLLQDSAKYLQSHYALDVTVQIKADTTLPTEVQIAFYRVARESLINAAKHAYAKNVDIVFDGNDKTAVLSIRDDGVGFDAARVAEGHFGLAIMHDRISEIGGRFDLVTEQGKGTSVTVTWFSDAET
jgi:signal transduction histidine kinase